MNLSQKKYAMDRVNQIEYAKIREIEKKFTVPEVKLTNIDRIRLVRSGKAKLISNTKILEFSNHTRDYISYMFDFSNHESVSKTNSASVKKASAPIKKKSQEIKDQIMLGDAEEALKMITELESM